MTTRPEASGRRATPLAAFLLGAMAVGGATLAALPLSHTGRAVPALLLVLPVLATAVIGGRTPSLAVAGLAGLALATVFLPPVGTPRVRFADDLLALAVFLVVATALSGLLGLTLDAERRRRAADESRLATLQQVDEHRRALLRSVSHELRTPLGIVHGAAAELVDEGDRYSPAERDRLLELLVDETGRLERIVANLLAMSRIDADAWEPSRELVDLGEIVIGAVRRLGPSARASRVAIEVEPALPLVLADPVQLDLVVTNLLENAVRHTDSGERIWVEASGHDRRVQLAVTDQGRGMSAELARRAFEPFVAGPGSTTTGIGLALCRAIVTAHGGTIHLEPGRAGKGTRAVVELAAG